MQVYCGGVIGIVLIFNAIVTHVFKIPPCEPIDMYSVPLQQLARTRIFEADTLTEDEKNQIHRFFPKDDKLEERYISWLSDPIRGEVDTDYFFENRNEFFGLWFRLLLKYPVCYIDSFFCNTSGYWYPEEVRVSVTGGSWKNDLGIEVAPICEWKLVKIMEDLINARSLPGIGMFFSTGFVFWIMLILFGYQIYQKQYHFSMVLLPMLLYWLTILLGPLNTEYRYVLYLFTCLPLVLGISLYQLNQNKKGDMLEKTSIK